MINMIYLKKKIKMSKFTFHETMYKKKNKQSNCKYLNITDFGNHIHFMYYILIFKEPNFFLSNYF